MSDNILQTIQTLLQDVIAPDVREIKGRLDAMQQQIDLRFGAIDLRFDAIDLRFGATQEAIDLRFGAMQKHIDLRFEAMQEHIEVRVGGLEKLFEAHVRGMDKQMAYLEKSLLSAFAQSQLRTEISGAQAVVDIRERVAVLESQRT
jgi:hypothetical protein